MKKIIVFIAATAFALQVNAQTQPEKVADKDVPATVVGTFQSNHPNAKMVSWKKMDGNYAAEYDESSTKNWAIYNESGTLVGTKIKLKDEEIPKAVSDYVNKNHKDAMSKEYFKMKDDKGTVTYGAKIKDKKLIFDSKGNYIKTEDCKE